MGAPRTLLEGASTSDMDSVAHAYSVAPARTYWHVSFARVIPRCPVCLGRLGPMARLPLAKSLNYVLLRHIQLVIFN